VPENLHSDYTNSALVASRWPQGSNPSAND
jgi:hypothetical protein